MLLHYTVSRPSDFATQNHIAKQLFPAEIPKMWCIFGRADVGIGPYGGDWEVSALNQPINYVILSKRSASKNLPTERYVGGQIKEKILRLADAPSG